MPEAGPDIAAVRAFWESAPLWTGESQFSPGSREFFEEHRRVVIDDCLGGHVDPRTMPDAGHRDRVLDLGCGPGFWTIELGRLGCRKLVAADLTEAALRLAGERCRIYGIEAELRRENAEALSFPDAAFTHVNCQGVIHHSPNTQQCVREIARVLTPGGTACISVYYRNAVLSAWPVLRWPARLLAAAGAQLRGRGRETIFRVANVDEIVRRYDGAGNPIGRAYTGRQFRAMLSPHFEVQETFLHFFPARSLPTPIPRVLHRWLDRHVGFMIYARLRKR